MRHAETSPAQPATTAWFVREGECQRRKYLTRRRKSVRSSKKAGCRELSRGSTTGAPRFRQILERCATSRARRTGKTGALPAGTPEWIADSASQSLKGR